ncbi:hypothetical protein MferCBS49748_004186 [Microsporum ferrugineum]
MSELVGSGPKATDARIPADYSSVSSGDSHTSASSTNASTPSSKVGASYNTSSPSSQSVSAPSASKTESESKNERLLWVQETLKEIKNSSHEEIVARIRKNGSIVTGKSLPYDTDDDIKYETAGKDTWDLLKAQVNTENKEDQGASTNLCFNKIGHGIQNEEKIMGSKRIESNNEGQEADTDSDLSPIEDESSVRDRVNVVAIDLSKSEIASILNNIFRRMGCASQEKVKEALATGHISIDHVFN